MENVLTGFFAGAISGVVMALVSHVCFKIKVFKSSLVIIDGSFFFRSTGLPGRPPLINGAGTVIHLLTSGIFGAIYAVAARLLSFDILSPLFVSVYVFVLWLSMLFVALPMAGEGILGRRSGNFTWFEQLILHAVFGCSYLLTLRTLLP